MIRQMDLMVLQCVGSQLSLNEVRMVLTMLSGGTGFYKTAVEMAQLEGRVGRLQMVGQPLLHVLVPSGIYGLQLDVLIQTTERFRFLSL